MSARRKVTLTAAWREKIRAAALLNRLRNHALGRIDMTWTQIRAAEILLRKCIPDLAAIQHTGEDGQPLTVTLVAYDPAQLSAPALPAPSPESAGLRH